MHEYPPLALASTIEICSTPVPIDSLPKPLKVFENLGIAGVDAIEGTLIHRADLALYEVRATITPGGDYLVMFPAGSHYAQHYAQSDKKINEMLAYRSSDGGKSWSGPYYPFQINYNQHAFLPLVSKGDKRIYSFGTQPVWNEYSRENGKQENSPIGWLYSDDDGYTWKGPELIRPENDPGYRGMSAMRMCETGNGTWLLGTHEADWSIQPLTTRQYLLRSEDKGENWEIIPDKRPDGWFAPGFDRMDEGRPIWLPERNECLLLIRTPQGHLWASWSSDDGKTWSEPTQTPLVQPDAPPMLTLLSDNKTLVCLHHNRHHDLDYTGLSGEKEVLMKDRAEVWASLSSDGGRTWTEPGYLFGNALEPNLEIPFRNYQCSYIDLFPDQGYLQMFVPHRWQQVLHLRIPEKSLYTLPKRSDLGK